MCDSQYYSLSEDREEEESNDENIEDNFDHPKIMRTPSQPILTTRPFTHKTTTHPYHHDFSNEDSLFNSLISKTPNKTNGFVVVETPKEYDIISDIISNENRNLSESAVKYMKSTYNYMKSFLKK